MIINAGAPNALNDILNSSQGNSSKANHSSATKHFNIFYAQYVKEDPTKRADLTLDNITFSEVTSDLVGKYTNYLGEAKHLPTKNMPNSEKFIRYTTAQIYLSDLKKCLIKKFLTTLSLLTSYQIRIGKCTLLLFWL